MYRVFTVSKDEAVQILISVFAISFAFSMIFIGVQGILDHPREFVVFMVMALVTIGTGFILHEMGHKATAIYYGAQAQFRMWTQGLLLMLITSLGGFLFAAPGAVYIYSRDITPKQNGIISITGPIVNLFIMFAFVLLALTMPMVLHFSTLKQISFFGMSYGAVNVWEFGVAINLMLALFNMIPAFPLDGSKVFRWSRLVWLGFVGFLLFLAVFLFSINMVLSWIILFAIAMFFSKMLFG